MIDHSIVCDGCGRVGDGSLQSAGIARGALRGQGWTRAAGGKDYCRECTALLAEQASEREG